MKRDFFDFRLHQQMRNIPYTISGIHLLVIALIVTLLAPLTARASDYITPEYGWSSYESDNLIYQDPPYPDDRYTYPREVPEHPQGYGHSGYYPKNSTHVEPPPHYSIEPIQPVFEKTVRVEEPYPPRRSWFSQAYERYTDSYNRYIESYNRYLSTLRDFRFTW